MSVVREAKLVDIDDDNDDATSSAEPECDEFFESTTGFQFGDVVGFSTPSSSRFERRKWRSADVQVNELVSIVAEYEEMIGVLMEKQNSITESHISMVEKHDSTKAELEEKINALKEEVAATKEHLENNEIAFNDVYKKYLKAKDAVLQYQQQEVRTNAQIEALKKELSESNAAYEQLKIQTCEKLREANDEREKLYEESMLEIRSLEAANEKNEVLRKFLEDSLDKKNEELKKITEICDGLIARCQRRK